jgi:hypothetical protein
MTGGPGFDLFICGGVGPNGGNILDFNPDEDFIAVNHVIDIHMDISNCPK